MSAVMPRRSKSGQSVKKEKEGARSAVEAYPDVGAQEPRQNLDSVQLMDAASDSELIAASPSAESGQPIKSLEQMQIEMLKTMVSDLDRRVTEIGRKTSVLESQVGSSLNQIKKGVCQNCQTDLVRMNVYVHGKKILLEYCPKCVPDPLLIMKD